MARTAAVLQAEARLKNFITKNINQIRADINKFGDNANKGFRKANSGASTFLSTMKGFIGAQAILKGFNMAVNGLKRLTGGFINANAEMQKFTVQFTVLLGSTESAAARMKELSTFAATTPFQLPEIVEASRLLQTFGGDLLATGDSLKMVGDMAAGAGVGFQNVAMWVGRAYTNIQAGRPFGEAAMRLQELGLLSGVSRSRLEDLSDEGASAQKIWAAFREEMGKFDGMMKMQSRTFGGLMSTIRDNMDEFLRKIGAGGIFDVITDSLASFVGWINENRKAIEEFALMVGDSLEVTFRVLGKTLKSIIPSVKNLFGLFKPMGENFFTLENIVKGFVDSLSAIIFVFNTIIASGKTILDFFGTLLASAIGGAVQAVMSLSKALWKLIKFDFKGAFEEGKNFTTEFVDTQSALWGQFGEDFKTNLEFIGIEWKNHTDRMAITDQIWKEAKLESDNIKMESENAVTQNKASNVSKRIGWSRKERDAVWNSALQMSNGITQLASEGAKRSLVSANLAKRIAEGEVFINAYRAGSQTLADPTIPTIGKVFSMIGIITTGLANLSKIQGTTFAARGVDFVTNGRQNLVVGDNPGVKERVTITPLSSSNFNGAQPSTNVRTGDTIVNVSGNIGSRQINQISEAVEMSQKRALEKIFRNTNIRSRLRLQSA